MTNPADAHCQGTFQVLNYMGGTITNVLIVHNTTDWGKQPLALDSVAQGATVGGGKVSTDKNNVDRWTVSFHYNGSPYFGQENCGFEPLDNIGTVNPADNETSTGIVTIKLNGGETSYDIIMPQSDRCNDNALSNP